ncbi:helix-turn-helix domain-containing protein [bacterium]|nr:MAG: helix-turn-helix domain-containing protein [bacterium]
MSEKHPDKKPETPAPAPAPSVGSILRQRRQMRGQSLDAVHQATRIPRGLLQALEEDRHGDFAAPVYLHGFLKSYCDHLELDYLPLWSRVAPAERTAEEEAEDEAGPDFSRLASPSVMPLMVLGGLLTVGIAAWGVSRLAAAKKAAPPAPEVLAPAAPAPAVAVPAVSTDTAAAPLGTGPEPAPVPAPPSPAPALTYPARLLITATAGGQVNLRRDGRLVFDGRLPPGKYLDWRGNSFVLHASNPKGLRVELGGQPVDLTALKPEADGSYRLGKK